jgi:hypothetical protein
MPEDNLPVESTPKNGLNWLVYALTFAVLVLGVLVYILWYRAQTANVTYQGKKLDTTGLLQQDQAATTGELTVDGKATINGDLHVMGTITADGGITTMGTDSATNTNNSSYYYSNNSACIAQVICNSTLLQAGKEFVIQPSSPYVVGGTIRGLPGQVVDVFQLQNSVGYPMVNVTANGSIGINNPAPQYSLDVNGQGRFLGHTAYGNVSAVDNPSILTPLTGTPIIRVNGTQEVVTNLTPGYDYYSGESSEYFVNLGQSATSQLFTGGYHAGEIMSGNPQNYNGLAGETGLAIHEGTGNIGLMAGVLGYTFNNSSGTLNAAAGTFGFLKNNANGVVSSANGAGGLVENADSGTMTIANGLSASVYNGSAFAISGSGSIGNANGVTAGITNHSSGNISNASVIDIQRVVNNGSGSIGTVHGLYIADESGIASSSESYNVYSRGVASKNVFDGAISIGGNATVFGTDSKLMVNHNPAFGFETTDNATAVQINAGVSDTGLVLQGTAFGTGDLQQWQGFDGAVIGKVTSTGSVGIGTGTVTHELTVTNTTTTNVAKFNGSGGTQCTVVTGTGWSCSSDETLKTNILNITNGLGIINQIQGVTYNWKADPNGTQQDGFIAQDIQKILPELVTTDSNGKLSLNKDGIMPYIIEAVKEQNGNIDATNKQLAVQGVQVSSLSDELVALTKKLDTLQQNFDNYKATTDKRIKDLEDKLNNSSSSITSPGIP